MQIKYNCAVIEKDYFLLDTNEGDTNSLTTFMTVENNTNSNVSLTDNQISKLIMDLKDILTEKLLKG